MKTKIKIICPIHGEFLQTPTEHIKGGCKRCHSTRLTTSEVKARFISKHGNKYNYSHVIYIKNDKAVKIFCNICNQFFFKNQLSIGLVVVAPNVLIKKREFLGKKILNFFKKNSIINNVINIIQKLIKKYIFFVHLMVGLQV